MGPLRSDFTVAEGINLYEMPNYDLIRRTDGLELMDRVDRWLEKQDEDDPGDQGYALGK